MGNHNTFFLTFLSVYDRRGHSVTTVRFRAEHDFEYPADELGANHTDIELAVWNADGRTKLISKVRML